MSMNNVPTVSLSDLPEMLSVSATIRTPLIVWGQPGVGKSAMVKQYAKSIGAMLVDIRLSQYESVDLRGLPDSSKCGTLTKWLMPATMPFKGNPAFPTDRPIVLFLDEIMQASPALQAVAFQLLHPDDRCVGEHELMDNVIVVGASNRDGDRAGVQRMLTPLANRVMHVNVESSFDAWKGWAQQAGIDPVIIAFLSFRTEHLSQFEEALKSGAKAFPTERSWEAVSKILSVTEDPRIRSSMIAATIGTGVEAELTAFLKVQHDVPKWSAILADPEQCPIPDYSRRDVLWSVVSMIFKRVDVSTIDKVLPYVKRLPVEYQTVLVVDISRNKTKLLVQSQELASLQTKLGQGV